MKAFAMLGLDRVGWIEKPRPECGPLDAIVRPITVSPCTSDVHTVFEGDVYKRQVLEFLRLGAEILVGEGAVIVLEGHDGIDQRRELFDLTLGAGAEELIE